MSTPSLAQGLQRSRSPLWRLYEMWVMCFGLGLFALICLLSIPTFIPLAILLPKRWHRSIARHLASYAFRFYLFVLRWVCAIRTDTKALDALRHEPALIIIANHPSLLDVVMLVSRLPNAVCVMKASLLRNLLYGVGARMAGYISNENAEIMIEAGSRELANGAHFILFPEGGRSREFPVSVFSGACSLLAKRSGVTIQAVLVDFSTPYLGKFWGLANPPILPLDFRLRLGRRFPPPQTMHYSVKEIEDYYRTHLSR